jgi:hypothetical protein
LENRKGTRKRETMQGCVGVLSLQHVWEKMGVENLKQNVVPLSLD